VSINGAIIPGTTYAKELIGDLIMANKAFVHKGKIYCWGGYGFWRGHGMLIVFQEDLGEWELLPFTGELDFMYGMADTDRAFCFQC
jgi:hypothetical protein